MNNKANESFSAFLDGEASEIDIQRMLNALDSHPGLIGTWHDLSKTQAVMQDDVVVDTALEYRGYEAESVAEQPKKPWSLRLFQGGLAAAVAMVVVTMVGFGTNDGVDIPVLSVVETPQVEAVNLAQQQFEAQQRLGVYLREHAELASFTTGHVVVPAELVWVEGINE